MSTHAPDLSALLVPVSGQLLVVPSAVVAEIIKCRELQRPPQAPGWLLGTLQWHHERLPVLCFEALNGEPGPDAGRGSRLAGDNPRNLPKCLLEFGGKSLLQRHLALLWHHGIAQADLVIGFAADQVIDHVGRLAVRPAVAFHFNSRFEQGSVLSLLYAREALETGEGVLLMDADVMLCDTSSIISEFALLEKPVVTFRNLSPKPYMIDVREPAEVEPALERALQRPAPLMEAIAVHARETHPWRDGRSSERVVAATDRLVGSGIGHLKRKPRNLVRHWKMRRALHYYRLF